MGATTFYDVVSGENAGDAFTKAVKGAKFQYGSRGYTGTIAEKDEFTMISLPFVISQGFTTEMTTSEIKNKLKELKKFAMNYAEGLIAESDSRVDDKWGPAGCIELITPTNDLPGSYLFFGWASE